MTIIFLLLTGLNIQASLSPHSILDEIEVIRETDSFENLTEITQALEVFAKTKIGASEILDNSRFQYHMMRHEFDLAEKITDHYAKSTVALTTWQYSKRQCDLPRRSVQHSTRA
jgi:hypothetical protein